MAEQTFTVVGTARGRNGQVKIRWTNDYYGHFKRIHHDGCTDIDFHNTPQPMTKLEALDWLISNCDLNEEQQEVAFIKKAEKARQLRLQRQKDEKHILNAA
jgi:hypothetical protein